VDFVCALTYLKRPIGTIDHVPFLDFCYGESLK